MIVRKEWAAEFIGTFALVFFGTVSVTIAATLFGTGLSVESILMIALAHGAAVGLMVYSFGHVSGAHINPVVTIGMIVTGRMDVRNGSGYIIFQIIGAILAAYLHMSILPQGAAVNYGTQGGPSQFLSGNAFSGLLVEAVLTFFLITTVFMAAAHKKAAPGFAGLAIGGMIFLIHVVGVPLTGASVNPARTFGPAVVSGEWDFHWIYWIGPIIGSVVAALLIDRMFFERQAKGRRS